MFTCNDGIKSFSIGKKDIYCYGTGSWASIVIKYCKKMGVKIKGCIVTSLKKSGSFCGLPVNEYAPNLLTDKDGVIIATVDPKNIKDIKQLILSNSECKNIFVPFDTIEFRKFCIYTNIKTKRYFTRKRKKINIFHYDALRQDFKTYWCGKNDMEKHCLSANFAYGHFKIVKKKFKLRRHDIENTTILHAAYTAPDFTERELNPDDGNIFCMGDDIFKDYNIAGDKNIYALGPYICYVKPILSANKIRKLKDKFGKTLLVAPNHSVVSDGKCAFDCTKFIGEIERVKNEKGFQTVMVSIGPFGFNDESYKLYLERNYKIVTSGVPMDDYFLRRLRTFIAISDVTMGNDCYSSFLGYSVSLNKPFYYYPMDIDYSDGDKLKKQLNFKIYSEEKNIYLNIRNDFIRLFGNYKEEITKEQQEYIKKIWGKWNAYNGLKKP